MPPSRSGRSSSASRTASPAAEGCWSDLRVQSQSFGLWSRPRMRRSARRSPRAWWTPWSGSSRSARAVGNLSYLREAVASNGSGSGEAVAAGVAVAAREPEATTGIGHTRWATHGRVTEENAHPHFDTADRVHIVLNGIVENHTELRERLSAAGASFTSETDAEVVAHLISEHYDGDLVEAVRHAYLELRGHYAFVAMCVDEPRLLVAARKECPLVVGVGAGERFVASAIPAFLRVARR